MPRVRVRVPVRPSEDPRKCERALRAVFPDAVLQAGADELVAQTDSLQQFRNMVWKARILDAARRVLLGGLDVEGRHARFQLSKQAAFGGHLSFGVGDAPLGEIEVDVTGDGLEALFKEIAPPTLKGRPVSEEAYEKHLEQRKKRRAQTKHDVFGEEE